MFFEQKKLDLYTLMIWKMEESDFLAYKNQALSENFSFLSQKRQQEKLTTYLQLEHYLGTNFQELIYTQTGKPVFKNSNLSLSITHKFPWHLILFSDKKNNIGIDIEKMDLKMLKIYPRFLSEFEDKIIENLSEQEKIFIFTLFWAAKECAVKIWNKKYLISQLFCSFLDQKNHLIQIKNNNFEVLNLTFFIFQESYIVVLGSES